MRKLFSWPLRALSAGVNRMEYELSPGTPSSKCGLSYGLMIALLCLLALVSLGGCTNLSNETGATNVSTVSDKVVVESGRALILANLAYQTVGTAAAVGIEKGLIVGETKVRVQKASQKATDALVLGEKALSAADKGVAAITAMDAIEELCGIHASLSIACEAVK